MQKRPTCPRCLRPQSTCICCFVTSTPHATEVLILQHPLEAHEAKNTARLLHLSLTNSRLVVGETFDDVALHALMAEPRYTVLLYPPTEHNGHAIPASLDATQLAHPSKLRLVVLDATWRKSRKMLHLSPLLQGLPRLSLQGMPASGYAIRKAHKSGQLSTLEAACAALAQLEGASERFTPLLLAFSRFVAQQQSFAAQPIGDSRQSDMPTL